MSQPSADNHASFTDAKTWVWNTKFINNEMYNLAYLWQDTFRICMEIKSKESLNKILSELEAGTLPDNAFPKGTKTISLDAVTELRYSEAASILEIHQISQDKVVMRQTPAAVLRDIYQYLRIRLAPTVQPIKGTLNWKTILYAPCLGLFVTLAMGGLLIYFSTMANPNPAVQRQRGIELFLDIVLSFLGVWGTTGVVLVVACFFILAILNRVRNPTRAEVVVIQTSGVR